jgi:hypothetical protein
VLVGCRATGCTSVGRGLAVTPGIDRLCLVVVVTLIARFALVVTRFGVDVILLDAALIRLA